MVEQPTNQNADALSNQHDLSQDNTSEQGSISQAVQSQSNHQHTKPNASEPVPDWIATLAAKADVRVNGDRPWDIQVKDASFYQQLLQKGSLGFGESYMDGLWTVEDLDGLVSRILASQIDRQVSVTYKLRLGFQALLSRVVNLQSVKRAFQVGEAHYDIGNTLFERMLDQSMNYSCGYWAEADNLDAAQQHKMRMICEKLELKPGDKVLEVGCGWGGLAHYMASNYQVEVVGITISKEQKLLAEERNAGLPVEIRLQDYRVMAAEGYADYFDKVVSVGMFEHVGPKNYTTYIRSVAEMMKPEALFLLHTIGYVASVTSSDPWINKYIFPNGKTPSVKQLATALEQRLVVEDWHNFGQDYDTTLMAWWDNFVQAWPELKSDYDERFYRMWEFYLKSSAAYFRSRQGMLWQILLSKPQRGEPGVHQPIYRSVR